MQFATYPGNWLVGTDHMMGPGIVHELKYLNILHLMRYKLILYLPIIIWQRDRHSIKGRTNLNSVANRFLSLQCSLP